MSKTTTVVLGERGFWALDDAFMVWIAYLVEEIVRQGAAADPWLGPLAQRWRVAAAVRDQGADVGEPTPEQAARLRAIAVVARETARRAGDLTVEQLRDWIILDDLPVSDGYSRTGDRVGIGRVLEVADGFIALLEGGLRPDPPEGAWLLGTGKGWQVMAHVEEARGDNPRFPRHRI